MYNVFTVANDKANAGYANTVKALASNYEYNTDHHISIEDSGSEFEKKLLDNFIYKIKDNLPANILFAGGEKCFDKVRVVQNLLKKQLTEDEFNKVSFSLNTERFNEGDTVDEIVNLKIITQEGLQKCKDFIRDNTDNIECFTVDISACGNKQTMLESAESFNKSNPGIFDKLPLDTIDTFFYIGGNGPGFTSKEGIDISKEYELFVTESFNSPEKNKPIVIFTHGFRTFRDLSTDDKFLNFEPIEKMYQSIKEKLNIGQECYVFSQKKIEENKTNPFLIKFKKEESGEITTEEFDINNKGSLYNKSLLLAAEKDIKVIATQEQQNFPIEAITAGVSVNNIDSIKWKLQAKNHELAYKIVKEKGENLLTAKDIYRGIINKEKNRQDIITKNQNNHDFILASTEASDEFNEVIKEDIIKGFN